MKTAYINSTLSTNEEINSVFQFHWFVKLKIFFWYLFWVIVSIPLLGAGVVIAIYIHMSYRFTEQALTNKRCVLKKGIISVDTEEMRLSKIETVEIYQTVFGRIFGYGSVLLTATGGSGLSFNFVQTPKDVKRKIEGLLN